MKSKTTALLAALLAATAAPCAPLATENFVTNKVAAATNALMSSACVYTDTATTLTPIYSDTPTYSEWAVEFGGVTEDFWMRLDGDGWNIYVTNGAYPEGLKVTRVGKGDALSTSLSWTVQEASASFTATRTRTDVIGYHLGSQTNKPLASAEMALTNSADIATLKDTTSTLSDSIATNAADIATLKDTTSTLSDSISAAASAATNYTDAATTLTERGFSAWVMTAVPDGLDPADVYLAWGDPGDSYGYEAWYFAYSMGWAWTDNTDQSITSLEYEGFAATRTALPGYVLGSDTSHILAAQAQMDELGSSVASVAQAATNYTDASISPTSPAFSNAVLSVGLGIDTNTVAVINELVDSAQDLPVTGATSVGALLLALAAAVAALKKNLRYSFHTASQSAPYGYWNITELPSGVDPSDITIYWDSDYEDWCIFNASTGDSDFIGRHDENDKSPISYNGYAAEWVAVPQRIYNLADRAINTATLGSSVTAATVTLPAATTGRARDFFIDLTIEATDAPTLTFIDPATGTTADVEFGADSLADIDTGDNIVLFTECDQTVTNGTVTVAKWLVSVKHEEAS